MEDEIVNKVAQSNLTHLELDNYLPKKEVVEYDLTNNLYEGLILKEKDFREFLKTNNWEIYRDKIVAIICSSEAIVPNWAYMLLSSTLTEVNAEVHFGNNYEVKIEVLKSALKKINLEEFTDQRVLVKGCGNFELSPDVYVEVTNILKPVVRSLMFGEACSNVPIYKSKLS